ncbi:MAG: EAL domain-containing protein [Thiohalophilus sp.]
MDKNGFVNERIAVNISSRQIRRQEFVWQLTGILQEYKVEPARLKIEITESLLLSEDSHTIEVLQALRRMGVENHGQLEFLRNYGAHSGQGFLFSKPVRIDEFITLIERGPFPLSA